MTPSQTYRSRISPLSIAIQLITLGILFASWKAGNRLAAVSCVLVLAFFIFALPRIIRVVERRFQVKAMMMLTAGRAADVVTLARNQILLQLFGASAPVDARLGLALCELGRYSEAIPCLDNAISRAPASEAIALIAALTRALFVTGDAARADTEGRILLDKAGVRIGETAILVARARMELGRRDPLTSDYLKMAQGLSLSADETLMLQLAAIEWDLLNGRRADDVPADADSQKIYVRAWIQFVRGRLRESKGQIDDALKSYARAVSLSEGQRIVFADLSRQKVATLGKDHVKAAARELDEARKSDSAQTEEDILRRKKKRR